MRLLLKSSASVAMLDEVGWSAFHHACQNGHFDVITDLLDAGVDVNMRTHDGHTGLLIAVQNQHPSVIRTLLAHGASVNQQESDEGIYYSLHNS